MGYLSPVSKEQSSQQQQLLAAPTQKIAPKELFSKADTPASQDFRTSLERQAEQIVGPNRLTMLFAEPNSELFLAMLARIVVALITGRSNTPDKGIDVSKNFDPSKYTADELLAIRQEKV